MNPGGEPERDETGLPPVDIEIPDDARELDRDVQAYYREQRAMRRLRRAGRWHRSLGRDGIVLPLLACCLILALIAGTLLTVFTATSDQSLPVPNSAAASAGSGGSGGARSAARSAPAARSSAASRSAVPITVLSGRLPPAVLAVGGSSLSLIQVNRLSQAMLILVPPDCSCGATLGWLADIAASAHAHAAYLVYTTATRVTAQQLYSQLSSRSQARLTLAQEADGILTGPASSPTGTLTAILVDPVGVATYASRLDPSDNPATLVQAITS